jgi:cysteine desulfurase
MGVSASSGSACSASSKEAPQILLSLNIPADMAMNALRISLSVNNTEEEIEAACLIMKEAIQTVRNKTKAKFYEHF